MASIKIHRRIESDADTIQTRWSIDNGHAKERLAFGGNLFARGSIVKNLASMIKYNMNFHSGSRPRSSNEVYRFKGIDKV